jgi:hypothetical protein
MPAHLKISVYDNGSALSIHFASNLGDFSSLPPPALPAAGQSRRRRSCASSERTSSLSW